jgi:hypothetical protein
MMIPPRRVLVTVAALACMVTVAGAPRMPASSPSRVSAASYTFESRINSYLTLRRTIVDEAVRRTPATADGEFALREAIAAGLREARRNAQPGDLLGTDVTTQAIAAVRSDLAHRTQAERDAVLAEVPAVDNVRVNERYPHNAPLATMPPLLLQQLAPLPPELQYRFLGTALIVLDADTAIVVDVVPHVIDGRT